MTVPAQEWPTSTVGPSCNARMRRVAVTASAREVSGFCTAVAFTPTRRRRPMTSDQQEPSAYAPWTRTTLRALTIDSACALLEPSTSEVATPAISMVEKVRRSIMLRPPILTLVELVEVQLDLLEELGGRIVAALDQQNVVAANETTPFIADLVIWQPGRAVASRSSCPRCASCRRCARWRCGRCRWRRNRSPGLGPGFA